MQLNQWVDAVTKKISQIQSNKNSRVTLFSHDPTGLGAQISRRILALRIALITGRSAHFYNESMYPYDTCYFPLLQLENFNYIEDDCPDFKFNFSKNDGVDKFDFWKFWDNEEEKKLVYHSLPEGLENDSNHHLLFEGVLLSQMKLLPEYSDEIEKSKSRLGLNIPYIAVHYRRGDKKVETPYVPSEKYRESIRKQSELTGIKTVFIASDSPDAVKELNLKEFGLNAIFDFEEVRYNNANHRFLMDNQDKSKQETMTAIKNIYLLAGAEKVIGQSNAHFATIAAAIICFRNKKTDFGDLIPGEIMLQKFHIKLIYILKSFIKKIIKKIFPSLTLRNSGKK